MKFNTKVIHAGTKPDPSTGAVMTPIYQTSTYVQSSPGVHKGYEYARTQNPTRDYLQANLAALEDGKYAFCFASGMAAVDIIAKLLNPGEEVIVTNDLYGGTYRMFTKVFENYGIVFHFISMQNTENIAAYINKNTRMIWVETPTNPLMQIIDIANTAKIAQKHQILLAVDNTLASPYLQQPLNLGADIIMHSATKYLAGHSDTVIGAIVVKDEELAEKISFLQNTCGAIPGPQDCFLTLRGIKTLHLRMQRHCENAKEIAKFLQTHPKVAKVNWPGLSSHPNHSIAKAQMKDFGGMISFELKDDSIDTCFRLMEKLKIFILAESLGGVESLCGHPSSMTHASIPKAAREKAGLKDSLIRLSVGIEDTNDLIADLKMAIEK